MEPFNDKFLKSFVEYLTIEAFPQSSSTSGVFVVGVFDIWQLKAFQNFDIVNSSFENIIYYRRCVSTK